mmetsp:Transcript_31508/g.54613  ORF Transcript_31508/g.54613 Transcript_31508/m.54613 type:complete len:440 (-) Transcript_31508:618-1937(-)
MEEVSRGKSKRLSSKPHDLLLGPMLAPMELDYFKASVYRKKPLVVRSKVSSLKALISDFLFDLDTRELVENTASDEINVWMRDRTTGRLQSFKTESADVAMACHAAGAALYLRSSQEMQDNIIPRINRELGIHSAGFYSDSATRGEIELFISPAGHTTDWHFDFQENFSFQVSGSKRWTFKQAITSPVRGYSPHFKGSGNLEEQLKLHKLSGWESEGEEFSLVMKAGNTMYHPAGILHKVECLEAGLSINISIKAVSNLDIICSSIRERLLPHLSLRNHFQADSLEEALDKARQNLAMLRQTVEKLTPEDLVCNLMIRNLGVIDTQQDTPSFKLPKHIKAVHKSPTAVIIDLSRDIPQAEQEHYSTKFTEEPADFSVHIHPCMDDGTESLMQVSLIVPSDKQQALLRKFLRSKGPFKVEQSDEARQLLSWLVEIGAAKI